MGHSLILGMTESGKTTLAKQLAAKYKARGYNIIVLDPLGSKDWSADFQTDDPDEFLKVYWASQRCMVFIDEAGDAVGRYDVVMQKTATRGRHWGHSNHYISQRGALLAATVRDQCSNLFLFTSGLKDRKLHAEEWNAPQLTQNLAQGQYFFCTRYSPPKLGAVF